ncbi:MAG: glycosyltransferase family 2 protein, partial [Bacteroidales bacterium]|nr:glycosyltransferase family 2 protein [Bacteroidales bacterium]
MDNTITCFLPWSDAASVSATVRSMRASGVVSKIFVVVTPDHHETLPGVEADYLRSAGFATTDAVKKMAAVTDTNYVVTYSKGFPLDLGSFAFSRMMQICDDTGAGMVYSDYFERKGEALSPHPVIDYQEGSLRDDFNFGSVILYSTKAF